ncbi:MAG: 5'-nucleotidase C-terminal domain-containing protein [Desulfobacterales bacterium]|nr:5'-nucleotidase C-terminal domain-containing protein [Desulfobacterales bacterium]MBF0397634.1 5'-nucleotidase C-terminal domain-containing protein [Desulfobacterales bacterium]
MKLIRYTLLFTILFFITAGFGITKTFTPHEMKASISTIKATILFFNDLHGNLVPFKITMKDGTKANVGGIANIAALVKEIREKNNKQGIKTFLLVAGDVLQGTSMSTIFNGKPDIEIFNKMNVSVMTIGNHEFDFGLDNLLLLKKMAKFPIISSNIIWRDNKKLMNEPSVTLPLSKEVSLTVIGATTTELLTTTARGNVEKVDVIDSVETVTDQFKKFAKKGPIILLSHSKFQKDSDIAKANPELTAIIGGHDQILFDPQKIASGVPVFQAFEKGRYLGKLDISINKKTKKAVIEKSEYIPVTSEIKPDFEVSKIVDKYNSQLDSTMKKVIGESLVFMNGERGHIRYEETNLGNFVADIMREYTSTDISMINAGGLRSSINKGPVTVEDIFKVMPYPNEIIAVTLTGKEIIEILTRSVQGSHKDEDGGFLHVSGIKFEILGKNVKNITVKDTALDPQKKYTVTTTDFIYNGGDGYKTFMNKPCTKTGLPLRELLVDTLSKRIKIEAKVEGRIKRTE